MIIKTNTDNRKALVKAISEFTGEEQSYLGLPSYAYRVGEFIIDRDGGITCETDDGYKKLKEHLIELGYLESEVEELNISIPADGMDMNALRNLVFMLHSKQYLLNRVVGRNSFSVSEDLIKALETNPPETKEALLALSGADSYEATIQGMAFDEETVTFTFPFSEKPAKNRAYAELAAFMVAQAREAKRVSAKEQKPENEKYYLRSWLLRLGLSGEGGKVSRKALLAGLKGHTAFRTPADEEKHKARLLAEKARMKE